MIHFCDMLQQLVYQSTVLNVSLQYYYSVPYKACASWLHNVWYPWLLLYSQLFNTTSLGSEVGLSKNIHQAISLSMYLLSIIHIFIREDSIGCLGMHENISCSFAPHFCVVVWYFGFSFCENLKTSYAIKDHQKYKLGLSLQVSVWFS